MLIIVQTCPIRAESVLEFSTKISRQELAQHRLETYCGKFTVTAEIPQDCVRSPSSSFCLFFIFIFFAFHSAMSLAPSALSSVCLESSSKATSSLMNNTLLHLMNISPIGSSFCFPSSYKFS